MLLGISLEVTVPADVDRAELHQIGVEVVPNPQEGFTAADVVEWGFTNPAAITALHGLGVRWNAVATGPEQDLPDLAPATTTPKENTPWP